jgi:hypothetical protein
MSVGFVAYSHLVEEKNAAAIVPVHQISFDADSYRESDTSVIATSKVIEEDSIGFTITLDEPGDSYGAMINIVNDGNIDEYIKQVNMSVLGANIADYVDYHLTLDDEDYIGTSYNTGVYVGEGEENRKQLFISVEYKADAPNIGPLNLDLSASLDF